MATIDITKGLRPKTVHFQSGLIEKPVWIAGLKKKATPDDVIGTVEDGMTPMLHEPEKPHTIQKLATEEHPEVREALEAVLAGIAGAKLAGARDEKDAARVREKIGDGRSPQMVRDYSGYRIAVDTPEAWKQTATALRKVWEIPDEQDEFEKGSAVNFHGHTMQVRMPGSPVSHEVQILPREVAANADADHALYEKARDGDKDAEQELKDLNRQRWIDFLVRNDLAEYKFGSTQANVPEDSEAAHSVEAARAKIADADLAGDGKDIGGNHVTVRYGVRGGDPKRLRGYLRRQSPFTVKLGKTESFPPSKHSDGAAVVMAPVNSAELHRIHGEIAQHADFRESDFAYKPHVTVAYVKPKAAEKYTGMTETEGKRFRVDAIHISHRDGSSEPVQLQGEEQSDDLRKAVGADRVSARGGRETGTGGGDGQLDQESVDQHRLRSRRVEDISKTYSGRMAVGSTGGDDLRHSLSKPSFAPPRPSTGAVSLFPEAVGGDGSRERVGKAIPTLSRQPSKGQRFLVPNESGGFDTAIVKYWNPGYNGAKPVGRIHLNGGQQKLEHLAAAAIPVRADGIAIQPMIGSEEEAEVIALVEPSLAAYVSDYLMRNTKDDASTVATDAAKLLIPSFAVDPVVADREVCSSATAIRDGSLNTLLGAVPEPDRGELLITVGSPGSGKTTGQQFGGRRPGTGVLLEAIPDDIDKFRPVLQQVLDSGRRPSIEWVWVEEPETTVRRMIARALGDGERRGIGRTVQVVYMAHAWSAVPKVLEQVRREFGSRIEILAVDNSGDLTAPKLLPDIDRCIAAAAKIPEDKVLARMLADLDRMDAEGRFAGEQGAAVKAAALRTEQYLPQPATMHGPADLRSRLQAATQRRNAGQAGTLRASAQAAWTRAIDALREDPTLQVRY